MATDDDADGVAGNVYDDDVENADDSVEFGGACDASGDDDVDGYDIEIITHSH